MVQRVVCGPSMNTRTRTEWYVPKPFQFILSVISSFFSSNQEELLSCVLFAYDIVLNVMNREIA